MVRPDTTNAHRCGKRIAARARAAICYVRRSTDRQEQSIPDQKRAIEKYTDDHELRLLRFKVWPKMYQSLRASCENDWKQRGIPEATYTAWMGRSAKVSRKHYTRPLDSEFAAVAKIA